MVECGWLDGWSACNNYMCGAEGNIPGGSE